MSATAAPPREFVLTKPNVCPGVARASTRRQADSLIRTPATGLRPYRAVDDSGPFWFVARILAATDTTVRLRYLCTDGTHGLAIVPRPPGVAIPRDARVTTTMRIALSADIADRYVGHRGLLFDRIGDPMDATVLMVDEAYVILRRHDKGSRLSMHQIAVTSMAVEVATTHSIGYSQGQVDIRGTEYIAADGSRHVRTSLMYSAWCSCGQFRHDGSHPQSRRFAVTAHLREASEAFAAVVAHRLLTGAVGQENQITQATS